MNLRVFLLFCLLTPLAFAFLQEADEDYTQAKSIMKKWDKNKASEVIFYLTRARNDYLKLKDRSENEEQRLVEISQALYWAAKMKPIDAKPFAGAKRDKTLTRIGEEDPTEETAGHEESNVTKIVGHEESNVTKTPEVKVDPLVAAKEALQDKENQKLLEALKNTEDESLHHLYKQALDYQNKFPSDLENQYLLFGQVLEEVSHPETVRKVLESMDHLRNEISQRNAFYENLWYEKMFGLKSAIRDNNFDQAGKILQSFKNSADYGKISDLDRDQFERINTRVLILNECKKKLIMHSFRERTLAGDGFVEGFTGNITGATESIISAIDSKTGQLLTMRWEQVIPAGLASATFPLFDDNDPREFFTKAMAMKVTGQADKAYDLFWELMKNHPNKAKISNHMQDCEQIYLSEFGKPVEELLVEVHRAIENGKKKDASQLILRIRKQLNHPLMAIFHHQVMSLKKKYDL